MDAGFAVLSYDKRGVGGSSGDWREASMDDLAADAAAALGFLRTRPGVRADAVGLFGHSEGGWLVLRAAAARDDLPWVVTNSCPGTTPALQERHALATVLRDAAASEQVVDETLALYDRVCEAARRGAGFAEAARLVESAGMPPALDGHWAGMDERMWRFLGRKQDHDPFRTPCVCAVRTWRCSAAPTRWSPSPRASSCSPPRPALPAAIPPRR